MFQVLLFYSSIIFCFITNKLKAMNYILKTLGIVLLFLLSFYLHAQDLKDGENIAPCLGQPMESEQVKQLISAYDMKDDIPGVKAGKGLTIYSPSTWIQRITFQNNSTYGSFRGKLPFGLDFGMSVREIREKFPSAKETEDYMKFYATKYWVEIKFASPRKKKIEFIAIS